QTEINVPGGLAGINGLNGSANNTANQPKIVPFDFTRCPLPSQFKKKTDEEKADAERFRKRILDENPYKLNRFGVLEIPGLPAMPVAGLTASEATKRLAGDPDFKDYYVRLSLLRLMPSGD